MMEGCENQWILISSFLKLPSEVELNRNATCIIKLEGSLFEKASSQLGNTSILLKHLLRNQNKWCVIERYFQDHWVQWMLDKQPDERLLGHNKPNYKEQNATDYPAKTLNEWCNQDIHDILPYIREEKMQVPDGELYEELPLDMHPPSLVCAMKFSRLSSSYESHKAVSYLQEKYFEALFGFNIPLTHFVKSKLPRVAVLCKQDEVNYLELLKELVVDIPAFDTRHDSKHMGLLYFDDLPKNVKDFRAIAAKEFAGIHLEKPGKSKGILKDLCNLLKIKDIKLQIILILELIRENNWDRHVNEFESNYENEIRENSINLRAVSSRFKRQKPNQRNSSQPCERNALSYFKQLDILFDKLRIVEALFSMELSLQADNPSINSSVHAYKISIISPNKEDSIRGFVKYILIPFWYKKLPNTVNFVANKIKGPDLTSRTGPIEGKAQPQTSGSFSLEGNGNSSYTSVQFPKLLHSSQAPPLLRTRTSSNLTEFLDDGSNKKRSTVASRSDSDVKLNHLQRRQMSIQDLSLDDAIKKRQQFIEDLSTSKSIVVNGKSVTFAQGRSQSFQRISRQKSEPLNEPSISEEKEAQVHVTATPAKTDERTKLHPILVASPVIVGSNSIEPSYSRSKIQNVEKSKRVKRRLFAP